MVVCALLGGAGGVRSAAADAIGRVKRLQWERMQAQIVEAPAPPMHGSVAPKTPPPPPPLPLIRPGGPERRSRL